MTLMTMISTATPKVTPSTEIKVMTETKVLLGRRYRIASSSSNGNPDMRGKLVGTGQDVNALGALRRYGVRCGARAQLSECCSFHLDSRKAGRHSAGRSPLTNNA